MSNPPAPRVLVAAVCLILGGLVAYGVYHRAHHSADQARTQALTQGAAFARTIELRLNQPLDDTEVLGTLVRQGNGRLPAFQEIAGAWLAAHPGAASLALEPGGVIADIAPRAGNERLVGLNVLNDPVQRPEALAAIQGRRLSVSGPLRLPRGEAGVVGRLPIFSRDRNGRDTFWGFVAVAVRLADLADARQLKALADLGYDYLLFIPGRPGQAAVPIVASIHPPAADGVQQAIRARNFEVRLALWPKAGWYGGGKLLGTTLRELLLLTLLAGLGFLAWKHRAARQACALATERAGQANELATLATDRAARAQESAAQERQRAALADERVARAEQLAAQATERAAQAETRSAEVSERCTQAEQRAALIEDRAAKAARRLAEATERIAGLENLAAQSAERAARAEDRAAQAEQRAALTEDRAAQAAQRLAEADDRIAGLEKLVAQSAQQVAQAQDRVAAAEVRLAEARDRAAQLEQQALLASTSALAPSAAAVAVPSGPPTEPEPAPPGAIEAVARATAKRAARRAKPNAKDSPAMGMELTAARQGDLFAQVSTPPAAAPDDPPAETKLVVTSSLASTAADPTPPAIAPASAPTRTAPTASPGAADPTRAMSTSAEPTAASPSAPPELPPATLAPVLPEVPGVDVREAIERLGLSCDEYVRKLQDFAGTHRRSLAGLREALEEEEADTAREHAHSLAIAAGEVAAETLRRLARTLDLAIRDELPNLDGMFTELAQEAERVFTAIEALDQ